jgi:hypothetical protein
LTSTFLKLEDLLTNEFIPDYSVSQNTLDNVFVNFVRDECDTIQQTTSQSYQRRNQGEAGNEHDILDDTFDDGSFVITRSKCKNSGSLERISTNSAGHCKTNVKTLILFKGRILKMNEKITAALINI